MVEFKKPGVPAERSVKHRIKSQKAKLKVKHIIYCPNPQSQWLPNPEQV